MRTASGVNATFATYDIGSGSIKGANVVGTRILPGSLRRGPVTSVEEVVAFVLQGLTPKVEHICIGTAGNVENHRRIIKAPNLRFLEGVDLCEVVEKLTGRSVVIGNDMEIAATGMAKMFEWLKLFLAITWSGGIGVRWVKNGEVIGDSEAGHMRFDFSPNAPLCGCGLRGCAELSFGGVAIEKQVLSVGCNIPAGMRTDAFLDKYYRMKAPWAVGIHDNALKRMAQFLANLVNALKIEAVVWKGGVANAILRRDKKADVLLEMTRPLILDGWRDVKFYFCLDADPAIVDCDVQDVESFVGAAELARRTFLR